MLFFSLLISLGMICCEADHEIFFGEWTSPPDPSVTMPINGRPLVLYVPIHVDDSLVITNSLSLYVWFLKMLASCLMIVDLGQCSKFLSILIVHDHPNCCLWLSSHVYIAELLEEWNLKNCQPASTPFPTKLPDSSTPSNALPNVADVDLVPEYQCLVGCLLYLAIVSHPDLSYYTMWLGQFNASPTRSHFLAAKHVLRYLAGTQKLSLGLGAPSSNTPISLSGFMQNVGCSDANWASDTTDHKSISRYSFYFEGSLVSWSAVKQKSISLSSTRAEYYAMTHTFKEAIWLCSFLQFQLSQLDQNILISDIISCNIIYQMALFRLPGYLLKTCLLISLLRLFLFLHFLTITMFLAVMFHITDPTPSLSPPEMLCRHIVDHQTLPVVRSLFPSRQFLSRPKSSSTLPYAKSPLPYPSALHLSMDSVQPIHHYSASRIMVIHRTDTI